MERLDIDALVTQITGQVAELADQVSIILILNLSDDMEISLEKERVHLKERALNTRKAADLIDRFREAGFYVYAFGNEVEFMQEMLNGDHTCLKHRYSFVYSVGAESTGPGTRALIPAFCRRIGVNYLNSNAHARSLVWHKYHNYQVLKEADLPVPETWLFTSKEGWRNQRKPLTGDMVILKATYEAWAVGVSDASVMEVDAEFEDKVAKLESQLGQPITVQKFIEGKEIYVPILDVGSSFVPGVVELQKREKGKHSIVTFEDNLKADNIYFELIPRNELTEKLKDIAISAMRTLEIECIGRIDFRVDEHNCPYIIDVAEVPSLHPKHALTQSFALAKLDQTVLPTLMVGSNMIRMGYIKV